MRSLRRRHWADGQRPAWHLRVTSADGCLSLGRLPCPRAEGWQCLHRSTVGKREPCLTCGTQIHTDAERIGAPGCGAGVASGPLGHAASLDGVVKTKFSGSLKPVLGATAKPAFQTLSE